MVQLANRQNAGDAASRKSSLTGTNPKFERGRRSTSPSFTLRVGVFVLAARTTAMKTTAMKTTAMKTTLPEVTWKQLRAACWSGEGGIRTLGGCDPTLDFESSTIGHSVTSPRWRETRFTESPVSGRDNKRVRHLCQASLKPRSDFRGSTSSGSKPDAQAKGLLRASFACASGLDESACSFRPPQGLATMRPSGRLSRNSWP